MFNLIQSLHNVYMYGYVTQNPINTCNFYVLCILHIFCKDNSLEVCIAVKRHHYQRNSYKGKYLVGVAHLQFRGLAHFHHGRKQGSMHTDVVPELEYSHLDPKAIGSKRVIWGKGKDSVLDITSASISPLLKKTTFLLSLQEHLQ